MIPGEMAGRPHTPPPSDGASGSGSEALQKLGSSVCEQATQVPRLMAPRDPRGGSPRPPSQPLPAVYAACKVGSWEKALLRPRVEGGLGAAKTLSREWPAETYS